MHCFASHKLSFPLCPCREEFLSAVHGYLREEGRGKDIGGLKRTARIWDEERLGRAWIVPAVIEMIQVNSREGLDCTEERLKATH